MSKKPNDEKESDKKEKVHISLSAEFTREALAARIEQIVSRFPEIPGKPRMTSPEYIQMLRNANAGLKDGKVANPEDVIADSDLWVEFAEAQRLKHLEQRPFPLVRDSLGLVGVKKAGVGAASQSRDAIATPARSEEVVPLTNRTPIRLEEGLNKCVLSLVAQSKALCENPQAASVQSVAAMVPKDGRAYFALEVGTKTGIDSAKSPESHRGVLHFFMHLPVPKFEDVFKRLSDRSSADSMRLREQPSDIFPLLATEGGEMANFGALPSALFWRQDRNTKQFYPSVFGYYRQNIFSGVVFLRNDPRPTLDAAKSQKRIPYVVTLLDGKNICRTVVVNNDGLPVEQSVTDTTQFSPDRFTQFMCKSVADFAALKNVHALVHAH